MPWSLTLTDKLASATTATGQAHESKARVIRSVVGPYIIDVFIDDMDRFLGIKDIKTSADFRTIQNRLSSIGTIDADDLYKDD